MAIHAWPEAERPRERLFEKGAPALSDAELLAVLIRNGTRGTDAVALARHLLAKTGGLRGLLASDPRELRKEKGFGPAKAAALLAAAEIIRRALRQEVIGKNVISDPEAVIAYLYASLRDRKKEVFKVLFLDKANRIIDETDLFEGTIDEAAVHPREVIRAALERHATGLVLVHNHPSGRVEPSIADREMTTKLAGACSPVGIKVLDHLIVGGNRYLSFREEGWL